MIQIITIRILILFTSLFFLMSCSGKFYNPKIEKGIFSDKNYIFNKSKK